ncbi:hypothetical protein BASA62_005878 [Batrachochytrium salamandrivorans]|nr:hypothetical protein BASA62_005878 [Batrachochytrium salamandrivorans]
MTMDLAHILPICLLKTPLLFSKHIKQVIRLASIPGRIQNSTTVSNEQYVAEIVYTARIIKEVIGVTPRFFRPPYGDIDDRIRAILLNLGLIIVEWNVDSQDADGALDVAQQFQTKANAGSDPVISLEHDLFATSEPQAGAALDAILAGSGKYTPMPLDKCLGYAAYDEGFWDRVAGKGLPPVNPNPVSPTLFPAIVLLQLQHCNSDSLSYDHIEV